MTSQQSEKYFLYATLIGAFILCFFIFKPFLYALILALIFSVIFGSMHKKIFNMTGQKKRLSAFISSLIVFLCVVIPFILLGTKILQEAINFYSNVGNNAIISLIKDTLDNLSRNYPNISGSSPSLDSYLNQGVTWLVGNIGSIFSNTAQIIIELFVFLGALYYLFKDGKQFRNMVISLSPLEHIYDEKILDKLELTINSSVKGTLLVALIQGILTGIGFTIFGVPNPALWGAVAALSALIPSVGTALIIAPATLFLFLTGPIGPALGLLIWGAIGVGLIDNFLGPKLIASGSKLHPFLVLLSVFGGLSLFGPIGFLLGPFVLSLLFVLFEVYSDIRKNQKQSIC